MRGYKPDEKIITGLEGIEWNLLHEKISVVGGGYLAGFVNKKSACAGRKRRNKGVINIIMNVRIAPPVRLIINSRIRKHIPIVLWCFERDISRSQYKPGKQHEEENARHGGKIILYP